MKPSNGYNGYGIRQWYLYWLIFAIVLAVVDEPWLRTVSLSCILCVVVLYRYLRHRTLDRYLLFFALGVSALAALVFIQRGLPFFILAATVFIGFVVVPIYNILKRSNRASILDPPQ